MEIRYPEIGVCGLSCRLCPTYHAGGKSTCGGCKSEYRMGAGCVFITCAVKRKGLELCWQCGESAACGKWRAHREFSREHDTFVSYQKLEANVAFMRKLGIGAFEEAQRGRERLLREMLTGFNEGRSKRYYCTAATVLEIEELESALRRAETGSAGLDIKEKAGLLRSILDEIAAKNHCFLGLRK